MNEQSFQAGPPATGQPLGEPLWLVHARTTLQHLRFDEFIRRGTSAHEERANLAQALHYEAYSYGSYLKSHAQTLFSPITRLPPEIILHIFKLVAHVDPPHHSFPLQRTDEPNSLGWVRITHVNRQWRNLCLTTPDLWALHIGALPLATVTFLERAGSSVPLHVRVERGNPLSETDSHFDQMVARDLTGLVKELSWITPIPSSILLFATALQSSPLPRLELLRLEYEGHPWFRLYHHDSFNTPIVTPNMTAISFTKCFIPFVALNLLKLECNTVDIPCGRLLDIVRGSPQLKFLELLECSLTGDFSGCIVVPLTYLEHLGLHGGSNGLTPSRLFRDFLGHLSLPPHTYLNISNGDRPDDPEELDYILPAVQSMWRNSESENEDTGPEGLELKDGSLTFYSEISFEPYEHYEHPFTDDYEAYARADFDIPLSRRLAAELGPGGRLAVHAEFASITAFSVGMDEFDFESWCSVFRALPSLHTLHLIRSEHRGMHRTNPGPGQADNDEPDGVFSALAFSVDGSHALSTSSRSRELDVLLPQLGYLWLAKDRERVEQHEINDLLILKYLASAMKRRAELHAPAPSTLRLDIIDEPSGRASGSTDARALRELVHDILWRSGSSDDSADFEDSSDGSREMAVDVHSSILDLS